MGHAYNEVQLSAFVDQLCWRLRLIEAQFALISEQLGMPCRDVASMTPTEVVDLLVRAGDRVDTPEPLAAACQDGCKTSSPLLAAA
jgi:hypothetical protein